MITEHQTSSITDITATTTTIQTISSSTSTSETTKTTIPITSATSRATSIRTTRSTISQISQTNKPTSDPLLIEEPSNGLSTLYILCIVIGCVVFVSLVSYGVYALILRQKLKMFAKNTLKSNKRKTKQIEDVEFDEIK
jgi:hypothetical protein